jgi:hypothetical protein
VTVCCVPGAGEFRMIFGFNTDVKQGDTVYHVQSEVRQHERRLETQVFVRGRCIGKRVATFEAGNPSEQAVHEMLREQHRKVLEAIREGRVDDILAEPQLKLEWLSAYWQQETKCMLVRFRVSPTPALVQGSIELPGRAPVSAQAETDPDGTVELALPFEHTSSEPIMEVRAKAGNLTVTQKFQLRRKEDQ